MRARYLNRNLRPMRWWTKAMYQVRQLYKEVKAHEVTQNKYQRMWKQEPGLTRESRSNIILFPLFYVQVLLLFVYKSVWWPVEQEQ